MGENLKEENRDKNLGTETHLREGVVKEEKFPYSRKPSHRCVCQKFGTSKGTITKRKEKKNPQNMCLTTITSGDRKVAQTLTSTNREWGLGRKFIGRDHGGE